jgi:hypothetical protein
MDGSGKTVTAAKQDAARKIESLLAGSWYPTVIGWKDSARLITRGPDGWKGGYICYRGEWSREPCLSCSNGHSDDARQSCVESAVLALAQDNWTEIDDTWPIWDFLRKDRRKAMQGEWQRWCAFQRAYKAAPADTPEQLRHQWACDHQHAFMLA